MAVFRSYKELSVRDNLRCALLVLFLYAVISDLHRSLSISSAASD